jgi:hypothetical protein
VVRAAAQALDRENVDLVLPFVRETGEDELRRAFDLARKARTQGSDAREVADRYFFETAVRIHRAGEGAPFTGLKPAGLDVGPVIPIAEAAIAAGDPAPLADFLATAVRDSTLRRYAEMDAVRPDGESTVAETREYVERMLGLQVWAHKLYERTRSPARAE